MNPAVLDVSTLPTYGYRQRSLTWWATMGMILIEGAVFLAAIATYFYLRGKVQQWPPEGAAPSLLFGSLNLAIMLLSGIGNHFTAKAAHSERLRQVRIGLVVGVVFSAAFLVVHIYEYPALNTTYTGSAYGSATFALLTLHTVHVLTDFIDTVVLTLLLFSRVIEGRRFVDVAENCMYYWFVILSWIPIYLTIYIAPRVP